jgi:hypothetical protein
MGIFSRKPKQEQDVSIPANRQLNFNKEGLKLEWIDAVYLWEDEYSQFRIQHGWKITKGKGFREDGKDRFAPVTWQAGEVKVKATFDSYKGIVTEKVL